MKTILLLCIFSFFLFDHVVKDGPVASISNANVTITGEIDFKTQIMPILQKRCSPCHFPGGKMYERLPFDTAATILLKKEGILRRIKDTPDNRLIREFVEQNQK